MSRKVLEAIALGVGGLIVALVLTLGAFAIAGQDISQPAGAPMFTAPPASPSPTHDGDDRRSPDPEASPSKGDGGSAVASPAPESGAEDHGGGSGSSREGSGGSDDGASVSSGSGSGSSEGSGSDSSGSDQGNQPGDGSGSAGDSDDSGGHEDD